MNLCDSVKPYGKIALIKTKKAWFKYNPNVLLCPTEQKEQYKRGCQNKSRTTFDIRRNCYGR